MDETYLNHPNFGLLFSLCRLGKDKLLYTTLYAQRLFFIVLVDDEGIHFESISRQEAKGIVEGRLRELRRAGLATEVSQLQVVHRQTFQ